METRSTTRNTLFSLAFSGLALSASPALAEDYPFHVAANIGRATVDDIGGTRIDESSTYSRLGTGYRFSPWLEMSGAYVNLGTITSRVSVGAGATIPVKATASGFEFIVSGRVPVSDALSLTADAGVLRWTGDTRVGGTVTHDSGSDSTWGVGAEYRFTSRFVLSGGWRRYTIDDVDADTTWVGLKVCFGDTQ